MRIGFIGLGNMGAPMARNLAAAGHAVTGFDTARVAVEGVTPAPSAAEAARDRDAVVTMLPSGAILRAVAADTIPAARPGTIFLDCSTDRRRQRPRDSREAASRPAPHPRRAGLRRHRGAPTPAR